MNGSDKPSGGLAGGVGALAACCAVKVLILTGVLAGVSGLATGGIALGAGAAVAAAVWLAAVWLRRRRSCPTPQAARPAAEQPAGQLNAHRPGEPLPEQPELESNLDRFADAPSARETAHLLSPVGEVRRHG